MKRNLNLSLIFLVGLSIFLFFAYSFSKEPLTSEAENFLADDFQLQDTNQNIISLSDYKGKQPVILFFWTSWCPFCQKELRVLNNRYASLAEDGFAVLAINVGESPDKVKNFLKDYNLAYHVLLDKDTYVSWTYEIIGVPTYILINKEGYIVFKDNYFPLKQYQELISK
ncbi:MAG: TlpA family protein disulfide reductase [Candidatus Omnitrophica bacterium]|nr:TlpA family protein disulfide reductase [Candidatus Omnitrophota bacterium]